jgi:hydrogenase-4 component F
MTALLLTLLAPLLGALALALVRPPVVGGWLNLAVSALTLAAAGWLAWTVALEGRSSAG